MIFKRSSPEFEKLTLKLGDHGYAFNTPAGFDFTLAARSCVPSAKIRSLIDLPEENLPRQAATMIKKRRGRLAQALSGVLEDGSRINDVLKETDPTPISNDNVWRPIISVLMAALGSDEQYKTLAPVKYMQCLSSAGDRQGAAT